MAGKAREFFDGQDAQGREPPALGPVAHGLLLDSQRIRQGHLATDAADDEPDEIVLGTHEMTVPRRAVDSQTRLAIPDSPAL